MKKLLPKLLVFCLFLTSIFYFLFSPVPAHAASQTASIQTGNTLPPSNTNPDVPDTLHNWTQTVMIEVMSSLSCQISGIDPINPKQSCLGIDQKDGKIGFLPSPQTGGAIGFMGNMIAVLYTPPLHTTDYFQNLAANFGLTKHAFAQTGAGFQGLSPLMGIWIAFRNIVYLILVIIFVAIGLAIMLRIKIDPRTVMTIQNQIPKIIIGILAVTFSFAIAGFLIDLMWLFIYLIYNLISPQITSSMGGLTPANFQNNNPFGVLGAGNIWSAIFEPSKGIGVFIADLLGFNSAMNIIIHPNWWQRIITIITPIFDIAALSAGLFGFLGGFIALIIIGIAVLVALFRLWFTLIKAYVYILLDVVLAPFWIIGGIIPGSPINLSGWLKDISANLLAFPITIAMFMLGKVFMDNFGKTPAAGQSFVPPLIGNPGDPSLIGSLISLGIILMTPNVVNMLKQMVKAPKMDTGLGKALGTGISIPRETAATVQEYYRSMKPIGEKQGLSGVLGRILK